MKVSNVLQKNYTVTFRFKEVLFIFLKSKFFDLRKILCSKEQGKGSFQIPIPIFRQK